MDRKIAELIVDKNEKLKARPFVWKFKHCTATHVVEFIRYGTLSYNKSYHF